MIITFDMDDVIFNTKPLIQKAYQMAGKPYEKIKSWNIEEGYDTKVRESLIYMWSDEELYHTSVLDQGIPQILNSLMKRHDLKVLFVTERRLKQKEKSFQQLLDAGIHCTKEQVYDEYGKKSDILKRIGTDLHFDDSPLVVSGCLTRNIPVVMISNNNTLYNHYLRSRVEHYNCLRKALIKKGLYNSSMSK